MALAVTIAGADWTPQAIIETLRINDRINTRSRLSLTVIVRAADVMVSNDGLYFVTQDGQFLIPPSLSAVDEDSSPVGASISIAESSTVLFGGLIDSYVEQVVIDGNEFVVKREVEAVSYDALADRRLVAASYESGSQTLSTIVSDIVTNFLTGDGVTTTGVQSGGIIIPRIKFNYIPASKVFDELSSITGWVWWIDDLRVLHFQPRSQTAAPFVVDETNCRNVRLTITMETYRNRQLVRAGVDLTASRTDNFTGDGTQKAWTLAYPVGEAPTSLTVGGVAKTVGIRGVDTGKDWYYQIGDPVITQDDGAAAVGSGVAISIAYKGQYPILIDARDDSQVAQLAAVSGTSGIVDEITNRANVNSLNTAETLANGLLRRYGRIPRRVTFETDSDGLAAGQLLTCNIPTHAVTGTWLIDSVQAADRFGRELAYVVEALSGEALGGWETFFEALTREGAMVEFRENEVVVLLRTIGEQVTLIDTLTAISAAPESRVGYAIVDQSEVGV
jgi:hypothetical protein